VALLEEQRSIQRRKMERRDGRWKMEDGDGDG
jgi:hypothetical protein